MPLKLDEAVTLQSKVTKLEQRLTQVELSLKMQENL